MFEHPPIQELKENRPKPTVLTILQEQMADCTVVNEIEETADGRYKISFTINDKETWARKLDNILPQIGHLYFLTYEPKDSGRDYEDTDVQTELRQELQQKNSDYCSVDKMYLLADADTVEGFQSFQKLTAADGRKVFYEILTAVQKKSQGKNIGSQLMEQILKEKEADAIVAISVVPAAMKEALALARTNNANAFFGGYRLGEYGQSPTSEEQQTLAMLYDVIKKQVWEKEYDSTVELPDGMVAINGATVSPLEEDDLNFSPDDPLGKTFKQICERQKETEPGTIIFGIFAVEFKK